jgi:iron complex outermembrane recepter protein
MRGLRCVMLAFGVSAAALAAGSAQAQTTAAEDDNDAIIVTAERGNRSLRDTATSVVVLTERDLAPGTQTTYDVLNSIPNVLATRSANNAPAIRGIDGGGGASAVTAFFAGSRPRVNFLVDGRTLTFNEAIYLDGGIWDLQQIEVYRGPQSTLQGRNAIGGVIAIQTANPTFDWEARGRALIGEDDLYQVSGALGGPIIADTLAFRVAADYRREDAFIQTFPYAQLAHPERFRSLNLRGKLLLEPAALPGFRSLLTVSYTDAYAPQTLSVRQPYDDLVSSTSFTPRFRTRATVGSVDTSWQASDAITLSAFLTATDFRVNRYVNTGNGIAQIDGTEYTAEPRIRFGDAEDRLSGFVAAFLFRAEQDEAIDLFGGGTYNDRTVTRALFGELTFRPSDAVRLTLGTRYEEEERDRVGGAGPFPIDFHRTFRAFLPRATLSVSPNERITYGVTVGRGYNAGGAGFAFNPPFTSFVYDKETVWNYEGFVRTSLLGGRLRLNGNIFFNDYSGLQLPFDLAQNPSAPATIVRNAERATTYGAEMEARFRAMAALDLFASAGILKTKVNRYDDPSIQGNDLPRAPAFSFTAGFSARPFAGFDASADLRYTDAYFSDVFNNARGRTDPYVLVNAQLGYRIGPARLFVSATNLFDKVEPIVRLLGATPALDIANLAHTRRLTAGVEFGF